MNPLSWLNKTILVPIETDVEGFFASSNPLSTTVKTGVAAVGTATLQQVNPIFDAAETGLEGVINTALDSFGLLGKAAEIPVDLVYQLLGSALKAKLDSKLGVPAPAAPSTAVPVTAAAAFSAPVGSAPPAGVVPFPGGGGANEGA